MVLMCVSMAKAIYRDGQRQKSGTLEAEPAE
jgi:hypothetical protein